MKTDIQTDDRAASAIPAAFVIVGLLFATFIALEFLANPIPVGVAEGQRVPDFTSDSRMGGGSWSEFNLWDQFDFSWNESNDQGQQWFVFSFEDPDCPFCWRSGTEMSERHDAYGDRATFITVMGSLPIGGHTADLREIAAYQDKGDNPGCYQDGANCLERPGEPHPWRYVEDVDTEIFDAWEIPGTPSHFIVKPNGEMAWNERTNTSADFDQALAALIR